MRITISLTDVALDDKDSVLVAAGAIGFTLDQYLDGIGIAIGDIDETAVDKLRLIDAIDVEGEVRAI